MCQAPYEPFLMNSQLYTTANKAHSTSMLQITIHCVLEIWVLHLIIYLCCLSHLAAAKSYLHGLLESHITMRLDLWNVEWV